MRTEREHCCDDLAVGVCDRVVYVTALTDLASMVTSGRVALAATDGSLLRRVRRILTASADDGETGAGWLPAIMIVLVVGATAATLRLTPRAAAQGQPTSSPVTAGASGGVAAGVAGGVVAGVAGGVAAAPVTAAQTAPEQASAVQDQTLTEAQRLELAAAAAAKRERAEQDDSAKEIARKIEARRAELARTLAEIEQARFALELRKVDSESQVKIETLQTNLGQLRSEQERAKKMVDVGTLNPSELKELEAKIRALELELRAVAEDRNFRKQDMDLRIKEIEQKRQYESAVSEYPVPDQELQQGAGSLGFRGHRKAEALGRRESSRRRSPRAHDANYQCDRADSQRRHPAHRNRRRAGSAGRVCRFGGRQRSATADWIGDGSRPDAP